ncbi:MAG: hypothetical protein H6Q91_1023 [Deltaproteobacteria bacterium]|nr:hypothetical protein [Deltaproteobacteria bacterium]
MAAAADAGDDRPVGAAPRRPPRQQHRRADAVDVYARRARRGGQRWNADSGSDGEAMISPLPLLPKSWMRASQVVQAPLHAMAPPTHEHEASPLQVSGKRAPASATSVQAELCAK